MAKVSRVDLPGRRNANVSVDPALGQFPVGDLSDAAIDRHGVATAVFDARRRYRYRLSRAWDLGLPRVAWCLLNPSTATAETTDRTLERVIGFSRAWGYGSADVVNVFAWRARCPERLREVADPVGCQNDEAILAAVACAEAVVVGWGNNGLIPNPATAAPRADEVKTLLIESNVALLSMRTTQLGQPGHPLYLPADATPAAWH